MINVIVISDDEKKISPLFKSCGISFHIQGSMQKKRSPIPDSHDLSHYAIAFLDLDVDDWQETLLELRQQMPVIAFSKPDLKKAVEAMRLGAYDFLEKPLKNEALNQAISRCNEKSLTQEYGFDEIVGASPPMLKVFGLIRKAAVSESNVLITGESGAGKEPVARAIHKWSPRKEKPFMTINCSAIPDTLLESELFGFEKGAFTGANYTKKGILEMADGGTVFFDEIGDVSPLFQTKILRVIQEGEVMRIGGMRYMKVDVRIIAATNKNLTASCLRGTFRLDLFYRLNVINIHLSPLRERKEDIPLLVRHFMKIYAAKRKDIVIKGITDDAINLLMHYSYPGNVRELENFIERAISLANSPEILPSDLPAFMLESTPPKKVTIPRLRDAVRDVEKEIISSALEKSGGNISRASEILGVYRQQLQRKIKKLKIAT